MNEYLRQLAKAETGQSEYAWIIEKDHLADKPSEDDSGIKGPSDAPDELLYFLEDGPAGFDKAIKVHTFRLYDSDDELYYTGRLATMLDMNTEEEPCAAPLYDFGMGWAGCTSVKWHGHSEWDVG